MTTDAPVTIVIVNYNGAHLLPQCLDAVDAQRGTVASFDTVVVDNASADESLDLLSSKYPWVRVIASDTNTGFAGGNNLALRELHTPLAVLLNNDAAPEPGWLANLIAPFDEPGAQRLGVVTGKVVFMPRFVRLRIDTEGFRPGRHDGRELGVRVYRVRVDGVDVTEQVRWERAAYGPEGVGDGQFRWTRPAGEILVPVPVDRCGAGELSDAVRLSVSVAAEKSKQLQLGAVGATVGADRSDIDVLLDAGVPAFDVINNVGGIVLRGGYGADRGFEEIDQGQYDGPVEVFNACGNGMAIRTEVGAQLGWFDDDFFMYYEDTDLSWRIRSRGWSIRYQPSAVLRHIHSASSKAWSPRWVFHVDRNRLLMLTKNASLPLAAGAAVRYPLTAVSMALRSGAEAVRIRRRPALGPHLVRAKAFASYLRMLPRMLARRARIRRAATVPRAELEDWLVTGR